MIRLPSHPLVLLLLLSLSWPLPALAQEPDEEGTAGSDSTEGTIHVVVGPGARSLEPMAIDRIRCFGAPDSVCSTVTRVLRRDMELAFYFDVIPERSHLANPDTESLTQVDWNAWRNTGVRFLIKGEVRGPEPYKAELRLYNVTDKQVVAVSPQSFADLKESDARGAAHRFANGVLAAITGRPGVFHTRIAFDYRIKSGVKGIGIVDMDGADRASLVNNGSINMLPAWGFGGVYYTSFLGGRPELYFGKRKFSKDHGHYRKVAVSPNGGTIVASISYGGQSDLYLLGKDGRVERNLTNTGADEVSPTFSPDGSRLAFVSSEAGGPQIYVMSVSGGDMSRLTYAGDYNFAPDWGSGDKIAFAALDENVSDIFTVDLSGTITRLTQDQGSNKDPTWSPDGRWIAFISHRDGKGGLWLMSADGRYQKMVLAGGGVSNPAWSQ